MIKLSGKLSVLCSIEFSEGVFRKNENTNL